MEAKTMRLLIVGSLNGQIGAASQIAISRGAKVQQASSIDNGLQILRAGHGINLIMADVELDIERFIKSLESERLFVPLIACGTGNDTEAAVKAIRAGAKEYLPLPPNEELIASVLEAVVEEEHTIIHKDAKMKKLLLLADQVAPSEASILITGPSGTGKEVLAHYVHNKSKRKNNRFIAINCAAIPENLLESELFGHEKGAFTGAISKRIGKFEEADGGTLLLDEVSEMDPKLQAKLLRAIQEREIDRVGSNKPIKVNVRILSTSNRNMENEVENGNFRNDLYFRLNVMTLKIPPLCERQEDIQILSEHFINKFSKENDLPKRKISKKAQKSLTNYSWPGNVRELENAIHRSVLLATGDEIEDDAILLDSGSEATKSKEIGENAAAYVGQTVANVERGLIIDTLLHCIGNRTHAATILGISIRTLRNKLKLYDEQGFSVPQPGDADRAPPNI